jgi:hypothetical protein
MRTPVMQLATPSECFARALQFQGSLVAEGLGDEVGHAALA